MPVPQLASESHFTLTVLNDHRPILSIRTQDLILGEADFSFKLPKKNNNVLTYCEHEKQKTMSE
jgi:hypothetical protein